jgi:hypothetical protein
MRPGTGCAIGKRRHRISETKRLWSESGQIWGVVVGEKQPILFGFYTKYGI